jgi:ABC-type microcin C transport system permease subunit YejB
VNRVTPHQYWFGKRMLIALFDAGLVMVAVCCALQWQTGSLDHLLPVAGTHGVSLGAGLFFINAANDGDFPRLMPFLVIITLSVLIFNLLADLSYAYLDPRIKLD